MSNYNFDLIMNGSGVQNIQIPTGYKFVSFINNTDNVVEVYNDQRTVSDPAALFIKVPYYTQLTIPISNRNTYTFIYTDGGQVGLKKCIVIFSEVNLNISGVLGNPASGGSITVIGDGVGLARESTLDSVLAKIIVSPATEATLADIDSKLGSALPLPNGAATQATLASILAKIISAPATETTLVAVLAKMIAAPATETTLLDIDNKLGAALPLPTGAATQTTLAAILAKLIAAPATEATLALINTNLASVVLARDAGRTSTKITAGGSGSQTVSAVAGKVWGFGSATAAVTVSLLDNTTGKWFLAPQTSIMFPVPIECLTSIKLDFSGAGDAYIIWE